MMLPYLIALTLFLLSTLLLSLGLLLTEKPKLKKRVRKRVP